MLLFKAQKSLKIALTSLILPFAAQKYTKTGFYTHFAGSAYKEMVHNIISPIVSRGAAHCTLARFDIHHALPSNTNALIGRAAHIAVLDSELFIEKFLIISILKYFQ